MAIYSVDFKTALKKLANSVGLSNREAVNRDYKPKAQEKNLKTEQALLNNRIHYARQQYEKAYL